MAEVFVKKEYERAHQKVDERFDGGIAVGVRIKEDERYLFFPSNESFYRLAELKIEKETEVPMGKDVFYAARIKLQETEKGKEVKLEEVDLSKVTVKELIEQEMKKLRKLRQKNH